MRRSTMILCLGCAVAIVLEMSVAPARQCNFQLPVPTNSLHGSQALTAPRFGMSSASGGRITTRLAAPASKSRVPNPLQGERYSSSDWFFSLLTMPKSFVLRRISSHLLFQVALAALVTYLYTYRGMNLSFSAMPTTLTGSVMGLLLVFRTNSAYARFFEARLLWGGIMNTCRSLVQMGIVYLKPTCEESAAEFARYLEAFPYSLAARLGLAPEPDTILKTVLGDEHPVSKVFGEAKEAGVRCSPNYICHKMRLCIQNAYSKDESEMGPQMQLLVLVDRLVDALGACERLLTTPVPMSYSRHTSRFLTLWCATLPFILVQTWGWFSVPISAGICWALMGIEEIGYCLENPFNQMSKSIYDLSIPLDRLSANTALEIRDALDNYDRIAIAARTPAKA